MGSNILKEGINDLESCCPDLAAQWDHERNASVIPAMVTVCSNRRFYWKCSKGHSWQSTVKHRYSGEGCPYCAGQKVLPGFNDLGTTLPQVAAEWDHEKNGILKPADVMAGSAVKVWWKCDLGHSWQAAIYSRKAGTGCPYCAGQKILPGFNDLASVRPEIAREWDYQKNGGIIPGTVAPSSNRKYFWKCVNGHSWQASSMERSRGDGCPYCSGKRIVPGIGDLAHAYPGLIEEWDWERNGPVDPGKLAPSSKRKVWWKGRCGHNWQAAPASRVYGTDCPYCAGRRVLSGFNDLASAYPSIASEWCYEKNEGLSPETVHYGSCKYVWFKCLHGHEWRAKIQTRTEKNTGCPYCANRIALPGENDLKTLHPELMAEWDWGKNPADTNPEKLTAGSRKKIWWKCPEGHSWQAEICRRSRGIGCPYCSRKTDKHRVIPGVNDLASRSPGLAKEWDRQLNGELTPESVMANSNRTVWWKCKNGHNWRSTPNIRSRGSGCPYCDGKTPQRMRLI